jgi:molybdate-binding protein
VGFDTPLQKRVGVTYDNGAPIHVTAGLIDIAEAFLLEVLTSGYTPAEVEDAFRIALDRWRAVSQSQEVINQRTFRFSGSHDLAVAWLATHFDEISPGFKLHLSFSGSMAGLISLTEGNADVGVGLEAAARAYNLDFLFLTLERYDLIVKANIFEEVPIQNLISWLKGDQFRLLLNRLGGYDHRGSGEVHWT